MTQARTRDYAWRTFNLCNRAACTCKFCLLILSTPLTTSKYQALLPGVLAACYLTQPTVN